MGAKILTLNVNANKTVPAEGKNKTFLIGGMVVNYTFSKGALDQLSEENDLMMFYDKKYVLLIIKRIKLLPRSAIKQLKKLDLFKKLD